MSFEVLSDLQMTISGEEDPVGHETLRRMATVERYNDWIYQELAPYAGKHILEVGSGIGNMTEFFTSCERLVAIDRLPASVVQLQQRYRADHGVEALLGDITSPEFVARLGSGVFDTVLCLNVLEHIEDDRTALRHMYDLLAPGGRLLLFVPAGTYMFGTLDIALGHHRRYERLGLEQKVRAAGFEVIRLGYLNLAGIPGWWLNSRVLKRQLLPENQLALFNRLAPLFIWAEAGLRRLWDAPLGQSLLCVGQRPRV